MANSNQRNIVISATFEDKLSKGFSDAASKMTSKAASARSDVESKLDRITVDRVDTSGYNKSLSSMEDEAKETKNDVEGKLNGISVGKIRGGVAIGEGIVGALGGIKDAAIEAGKAGFESAISIKDAQALLQSQTGASDEQMNGLGESLKNVAKKGYDEDLSRIATSMGLVYKQTGYTGIGLEKATIGLLAFQKAFPDESEKELFGGVKNIAAEWGMSFEQSQAMVLKFKQGVNDLKEDALDTFSEYSYAFKDAGFTPTAMAKVLTDAEKAGAFNFDKVGMAVQELGIRIKSGDTTASGAIQNVRTALNDSTYEFEKMFADGGQNAQDAYKRLITGALSISDENLRFKTIEGIFGSAPGDMSRNIIEAMAKVDNSAESNTAYINESTAAMEKMVKTMESAPTQKIEAIQQSLSQMVSDSINAEGILDKVFTMIEKHGDTIKAIFETVGKSIEAAIDLANVLLPVMTPFINQELEDQKRQSSMTSKVLGWMGIGDGGENKGTGNSPKVDSFLNGLTNSNKTITAEQIAGPYNYTPPNIAGTTLIVQGHLIADDSSLNKLKTRMDTSSKNLSNK